MAIIFVPFTIALVAAVVRLSCSIFRESQMRLSELLLCVLLIALLTSGPMMLLPQDTDERAGPFAAAMFLVMSSLFVFGGAARGWSVARKRGETRANRRLLLLLLAWLQVTCIFVAIVAVLVAVGLLIGFLLQRCNSGSGQRSNSSAKEIHASAE